MTSALSETHQESGSARAPSTPYQLPLRATLLEGESLASLIARNAQIYRLRDPLRLVKRIHRAEAWKKLETFVGESWPPALRTSLAALLGLSENELDLLSYGTEQHGTARFQGHVILRDYLMLTWRRFCPLCMAESGHHRRAWDLQLITICTRHSTRLLDSCPKCGKRLTWHSASVETCSRRGCDGALRLAEPVPVQGSISGAAATLQVLGGDVPDGCGWPGAAPGDLVRLAFQLGAVSNGLERVGRPQHVLKNHPNSMHLVMQEGWEALADWPSGFHELLRRLRARADTRRGRHGLRKEFGFLTHWLYLFGSEPWCRPVAQEFASFVAQQDDLATTAASLQRYTSLDSLRHRHMTLGEAARFLQLSPETMSELADRENLFLVPPSGPGAPSKLRADRVKTLRDVRRETLLKGEAKALLGVSKRVLNSIESAGLLPIVPPSERVIFQRLFRRSDVDRFIAEIEAKVPNPGSRAKRLLRLAATARRGRTVAAACQAILEGRLVPAALDPGAVGLLRILVQPGALCKALPPNTETLAAVQVADRLGVANETVRAWIAAGFLEATALDRKNERGKRITEDALQRFRLDYATAEEVAAETGTGSGRWAADRLAFLGIRSVSGPRSDGAAAHLFRRADLVPEAMARLAAGARPGLGTKSTKEAFDMAAAIAQSAGGILRVSLRRRWNGFSDAEGSVFVQALTGRRQRFASKYLFRFNTTNTARLDAARAAWVAFAFLGQPFFLLVPWSVVRPLLDHSKVDRHGVMIPVDGAGCVGRFADYRQPL